MRSGFRLPELSLRLRLLLALLALAAVGLVAFALVSYRELDSYLTDRVDQQAQAAVPQVSMALYGKLTDSRINGLGISEPGAIQGPGPGPGPGPAAQLPPGTYGQLIGPDGKVEAQVLFGYGETDLERPAVPADLEVGTPQDHADPVTVGARGGGSGQFRLVAAEAPGGAVTVVAVPLADTEATLDRLALIELIVAGAVLVALAVAAWWVVRVGLRPLQRMGDVAGQIAEGDLSRRVEPANEKTEVGRLGLALNAMLSQIEGAFAEREAGERRLRRFLADASHELRTPLAAIRGYAELYRMGASREPEQVERSMGRIEAESERMGGLVDDLLTLARLDEVREPVRDRVELDALLADACEDARAASPQREITCNLPAGLVVVGNGDHLRRVFDNLLRNAAVHTPPESPIELTLRRDGEEAVARVRDHGPGLPPADPPAVFERFWRGSASRGRDDGGAGLGLAIVAAVVSAHGGGVEAANPSGGGAEFTVRLPLAQGRGSAQGVGKSGPNMT
jgi:two-component system OmpR family sensor kinase